MERDQSKTDFILHLSSSSFFVLVLRFFCVGNQSTDQGVRLKFKGGIDHHLLFDSRSIHENGWQEPLIDSLLLLRLIWLKYMIEDGGDSILLLFSISFLC